MIHGVIKGSQIVDFQLRKFGNHLALGLQNFHHNIEREYSLIKVTINQILYGIGKASKRKFLMLKISAIERGRVSVRVSHSAIPRLTLYISYGGSGLKR